MNKETCKCGKRIINPLGSKTSRILVVGDYPGVGEVIHGTPLYLSRDDITGGLILRNELAKYGISLDSCRITNLWYHAVDEEKCSIKNHADALAKEIKGRSFVLVMGSEVTKMLWECSVMEVSGLEMKHELFPGVRFFAVPNPAGLMGKGSVIGEFRLGISRLAEAINV